MKIRKWKKDDFDKGLRETLDNLRAVGPVTRRAFNRQFKRISRNPDHHVFVMEEKGMVVGTTTLLVEPKIIRNLGQAAHLEDVSTRKGYEGRGIAHKLIHYVIEKAKRERCYKIILDCSPELVPFYESFGFRVEGKHMRLDLPLVA